MPQPSNEPFVPGYPNNVFISYAWADNQVGWVDALHAYLDRRIEELLGLRDSRVWRDTKRLEAGAVLEANFDAEVEGAAIFLTVLSPSFIQSSACLREVQLFRESAARTGLVVNRSSRWIRVVKTPYDPIEASEVLKDKQETLEVRFYREIPQSDGRTREFAANTTEFSELAEELAQAICKLLRQLRRTVVPAGVPSAIQVPLAETRREREVGHASTPEVDRARPPAATNKSVEFLRRYRKTLIGVAVAAVAALVIPFAWRASKHSGPSAGAAVTSLTSEGAEVKRHLAMLLPDSRLNVADRKFAIDSLRMRKPRNETELSAMHRQVIEFLAWRSRRTIPLDPCGSAASWTFSNSLANASDVKAALLFLDSTRRTAVPLPRLRLDSSNLQRMNFKEADLRGASFRATCLDSAQFKDALLQKSSFSDGAEGRGTVFMRARLDSAQFALSSFVGANFYAACLRQANFADARLDSSTFERANISWASFSGASLVMVDGWSVGDARASHAYFVGARGLTTADFRWLTDHGAELTGNFPEWKARADRAVAPVSAPSCLPS